MNTTHELQAARMVQPEQETPKTSATLHDEAMAPLIQQYHPHDQTAPTAYTRQQAQFLRRSPAGNDAK